MTPRRPKFVVKRTTAGWHACWVAGNGETVWTTEVYTRRAAALAAVQSLLNACEGTASVVVRILDERGKS